MSVQFYRFCIEHRVHSHIHIHGKIQFDCFFFFFFIRPFCIGSIVLFMFVIYELVLK